MDLLDRGKARARELVADRFCGAAGVHGVHFTGSLAVDLGNARSDVDLIVLADDAAQRPTEAHNIDGTRVDVRFWTPRELEELVAGATAPLAPSDFHGLFRDRTGLFEAIRFQLGEVLWEDAAGAKMRTRATASAEALRRRAVEHVVGVGFTIYEDVVGCLQSADHDTGAMLSAKLLGHALNGYLSGAGDWFLSGSTGDKWVWRKLSRTRVPGLPAAHIRRLAFADPDVAPRLVEQRLAMTQALLTAAIVEVHRGHHGSWDGWNHALPARGAVARTLDYYPVSIDGHLALRGIGVDDRSTTLHGIALWGLLGDDPDHVLARASALPEFACVSPATTLRELCATGVARHG